MIRPMPMVQYPIQWAEQIGHLVGHFWHLDYALFRTSTYLRCKLWDIEENELHTMGNLWRLSKEQLDLRLPGDARVARLDDTLRNDLIGLRNALAHGSWSTTNHDGSRITNLRGRHRGLSLRLAEIPGRLAAIRDASRELDVLRQESIGRMKAAGVRFPLEYEQLQGAPTND